MAISKKPTTSNYNNNTFLLYRLFIGGGINIPPLLKAVESVFFFLNNISVLQYNDSLSNGVCGSTK